MRPFSAKGVLALHITMSFLKRALGLQDPHNPLEKPAQNCLETDPTVLDWLDDVCPSKAHLLEYFAGLFPFFKWIGHYNLHWFFGDLIAGMQGLKISIVFSAEFVDYHRHYRWCCCGSPKHGICQTSWTSRKLWTLHFIHGWYRILALCNVQGYHNWGER